MTDTVRLEKVHYGNFRDLIRLEVSDTQKNFVAANIFSLAEAYAASVSGGVAMPFGIYCGDTPVGFLMIGYTAADDDSDLFGDEEEEKLYFVRGSYLLWRFMIDRRYQGKGYGREALKLALDHVRTFPCGNAEYFWTSYEPENSTARSLYLSSGFIEEPAIPKGWDEIPAVMKL